MMDAIARVTDRTANRAPDCTCQFGDCALASKDHNAEDSNHCDFGS